MTMIYSMPHQKRYKEPFLIYLQVNACFFMRLCSVSIHTDCQLLASRRLALHCYCCLLLNSTPQVSTGSLLAQLLFLQFI